MSQNQTKSFYDRISNLYDAIADGGEHTAREAGLKMLDIQEGERVLEVGYGTGHSVVAMAEAVGPTGRIAGIDISDGMFRVATKRVEKASLQERVDLAVGVTPPLPYEDQQFDVVSMSFTLELFPFDVIPQVLEESKRVLRPGGRIGVVSMVTTMPGESDSPLEVTYKWMHHHFPHIVDCQPIPAEEFVAGAGFRLASSERISLFTMPVATLVADIP